jgi:hypothetical protein
LCSNKVCGKERYGDKGEYNQKENETIKWIEDKKQQNERVK